MSRIESGEPAASLPAIHAGDKKIEVVAALLRGHFGRPERFLVVGCGDGTEAALLAEALDSRAVGIDIVDGFHPSTGDRVELQVADARRLPFESGSFDLVVSYHALEHIPSPGDALAEMRRVVREGGGCWLGTPNRSRLIGYLGSRDASNREKLMWNLNDWRARVRGRFRNEYGAHAGFTRTELRDLVRSHFGRAEDDTARYYIRLYDRHGRVLALLEQLRLADFVYPSVYVTAVA